MAYAFNRRQNTGLGDYTGHQIISPTTDSSLSGLVGGGPTGLINDGPTGLVSDVEGIRPTTSTPGQQSHQPTLGEAIGGAIVLIGALWLTGKVLGELFGSSADLTAVERQILASA